ncbi:MAG: hypothetical protein IKA34_02320 [Bacteroidales bacterium]|nr:hypothetical protein [Bacteroidales bacterium]
MKKIKLIAMTAAMGMVFAACEPTLIDGPEPFAPVDATVLANGITYQQFADEACTQPDEAGNFLKFNSASGIVQVFVEGNESPLFTGAGGVVKIPVKRGQEPSANLIFRIVNGDGTFTDATKTVKCTPPTELAPEMLILVSDNGKKVWKYAATNSYGNGGHAGSGAEFNGPGVVGGNWWGVETPDGLADQLGHVPGGAATGDEAAGAYMVFTEDGVVTSYKPTGEAIRSGKFEVKNYDPERSSGWELGKLVTSEPALLFPWMINGGGKGVTEFDIMYFTPQAMTLVYTNGQASGGWGEITHWCFIGGSPDPLTMEGTWTYGANGYGNGGHGGAGADFNGPGVVGGNWWGVATGDELIDQVQHAGGAPTGDESSNAYMVFEGNTVTTYGPDGTKIRGGEWTAVMNDYASGAGRGAAGWELGKLTTSEPAILFPWIINGGGTPATEFDIMYYDANNMTLVNTNGQASGGWGEITHWVFVRK